VENQPFESSTKGSDDEDSNDKRIAKNDSTLSSMSVEQIQNLIADAVKAHLGGGSHKALLYKKPYTKRIDAFRIPHGYQPSKFQQFDGKGNPKQHVTHSSRLAIMLLPKMIS